MLATTKRARLLLLLMVVLCASAGLASGAYADGPAPLDLLKRALKVQDGVKDYTAKVTVDAKIPNADIPRRTVKVYVKRPDKVFIDSRGIVIIPKRALLFGDIGKDVAKGADVLLAGKKTKQGVTTYCLKLIPKAVPRNAKDRPTVLMWMTSDRWTINRVHVVVGGEVMAKADFAYAKTQGFWLPTRVSCQVGGRIAKSGEQARVSMTFADYAVNVGLTDEFMDKKIQKAQRTREGRRRHRPGH